MKDNKNAYDDIIHLTRPASNHPKMARQDRAKIFSPFAALTGHEDAIIEMQKMRCNKQMLSSSEQEILNDCIKALKKHDKVIIRYFVYDPGPDGMGRTAEGLYVTQSVEILAIDEANKILRILEKNAGREIDIKLDDIQSIASIALVENQ